MPGMSPVFAFILAVAGQDLAATRGAALDIAPRNVKLPLGGGAIAAGVRIGPPVFAFFAVRNTGILDAPDGVGFLALGRLDLCRPAFIHLSPPRLSGSWPP